MRRTPKMEGRELPKGSKKPNFLHIGAVAAIIGVIGAISVTKVTGNRVELPDQHSDKNRSEITLGFPTGVFGVKGWGFFTADYCKFGGEKYVKDVISSKTFNEFLDSTYAAESCQRSSTHFLIDSSIPTPGIDDLMVFHIQNGQVVSADYYDRTCGEEMINQNGFAACKVER